MFVHDPLAFVLGDADDMRDMAASLDKIAAALISAYTAKTGKTEAEVKGWMKNDSWFSADEAKAAGLADEVIPAVEIAAYFDVSRYPKAPAALRGKAIDMNQFYARLSGRSGRPPVDKSRLAASIKAAAFDLSRYPKLTPKSIDYREIYARRAK
jgi:hypothetical protein